MSVRYSAAEMGSRLQSDTSLNFYAQTFAYTLNNLKNIFDQTSTYLPVALPLLGVSFTHRQILIVPESQLLQSMLVGDCLFMVPPCIASHSAFHHCALLFPLVTFSIDILHSHAYHGHVRVQLHTGKFNFWAFPMGRL